jgi:hypothetical protein
MTRFLTLLAACAALGMAQAGPAEKRFAYVDLQPKANQKLSDNFGSGREGNNLAGLPKGEQTFEGVKFKIEDGIIQLGSKLLKEEKPDKVEGIKVGRAFPKLHLLHATGYGNGSEIGKDGMEGDPLFVADDTEIAAYKVRYEDGSVETIPVVYGKDVRDWWFAENSKGVTRGKVAWKGDNDLAKGFQSQVRLYLTTWKNPHPAKRVASIDYVKTNDTPAAPFCVAISLEEK